MRGLLYNWNDPPPRLDLPQYAKEQGIPAALWPLLSARFPEVRDSTISLDRILHPKLANITPPFAFPNIRTAAARISRAIDAGEDIVIFGDFDADGVTATAILTSTLRSMGGRVRPFIPLRSEGYGLTDASIARCLADGAPSLLVTVDCGITAGNALAKIAASGIDIIVTDHHIPDGCPLPETAIVAAPHLDGVPPECRFICGAGVAFTLAAGVVATRFPDKNPAGIDARKRLFAWVDALAIATVADVVPLIGENRIFASLGLNRVNSHPSIGLKQLILATMDSHDITERHFGFVLAPHINSAGRMADASLALDLLLSEDPDFAHNLAIRLKQTNFLRKTECARVDNEIGKIIDAGNIFDPNSDGAFVAAGDNWHTGVVGLAAAHASEKFMRPAALISFPGGGDNGRGSVRAPAGYDVHAALSECAGFLTTFGGHECAAGISLERRNLDAFRKAFSEACKRQVGAPSIVMSLEIAAKIEIADVNDSLLAGVAMLAPFGEQNGEPVFEFDGLEAKASILGKDVAKGLRLSLSSKGGQSIEALWFGASDFYPQFRDKCKWNIAATLLADDYAGQHSIKLKVIDACKMQM